MTSFTHQLDEQDTTGIELDAARRHDARERLAPRLHVASATECQRPAEGGEARALRLVLESKRGSSIAENMRRLPVGYDEWQIGHPAMLSWRALWTK
jgi:hypothetical protein